MSQRHFLQQESVQVSALDPVSSGAATVNGPIINKLSYDEFRQLLTTFKTGAVSGSPSAVSVTAQLQHGTLANGSDMSNYSANAANGELASAVLSAASSIGQLYARGEGLLQYFRIQYTIAFTGGTSPAVLLDGLHTLYSFRGGSFPAPLAGP